MADGFGGLNGKTKYYRRSFSLSTGNFIISELFIKLFQPFGLEKTQRHWPQIERNVLRAINSGRGLSCFNFGPMF